MIANWHEIDLEMVGWRADGIVIHREESGHIRELMCIDDFGDEK
jgi:hypothetical protein